MLSVPKTIKKNHGHKHNPEQRIHDIREILNSFEAFEKFLFLKQMSLTADTVGYIMEIFTDLVLNLRPGTLVLNCTCGRNNLLECIYSPRNRKCDSFADKKYRWILSVDSKHCAPNNWQVQCNCGNIWTDVSGDKTIPKAPIEVYGDLLLSSDEDYPSNISKNIGTVLAPIALTNTIVQAFNNFLCFCGRVECTYPCSACMGNRIVECPMPSSDEREYFDGVCCNELVDRSKYPHVPVCSHCSTCWGCSSLYVYGYKLPESDRKDGGLDETVKYIREHGDDGAPETLGYFNGWISKTCRCSDRSPYYCEFERSRFDTLFRGPQFKKCAVCDSDAFCLTNNVAPLCKRHYECSVCVEEIQYNCIYPNESKIKGCILSACDCGYSEMDYDQKIVDKMWGNK